MKERVRANAPLAGRIAAWLANALAGASVRWPGLALPGLTMLGGGVSPLLFDPEFYRSQTPGVSGSDRDLFRHYLRQGGFEGRNPNRHFDSAWYLAANPAVAASGFNPLVHFVRYGAREGRNPNPHFDVSSYASRTPSLPQGMNPLEHYLLHKDDRDEVAAARVSAGGLIPISVVIPTRNRAEMLARMIGACAINSEGCSIEFIIVDDGSTDGTGALLADAAGRMPSLRWKSVAAGGPARARNVGAALATRSVIMFTGDDIIPAGPDFFRVHALLHGEHPETTFAALGLVDWPKDDNFPVSFTMARVNEDGSQFAYPRLAPRTFVDWRFFYTSNVSVKKALAQDWMSGGFDTSFPHAAMEDTEFGYRLSTARPPLQLFYDPASSGMHHHSYAIGAFLDRQFRAGQSLRRLFELHPKLLAEFEASPVHAALNVPAADGYQGELHRTAAAFDSLRVFAESMESRGELGTESWHGPWVTALCQLFLFYGYCAAWPEDAFNLAAARSVILNQHFAKFAPLASKRLPNLTI